MSEPIPSRPTRLGLLGLRRLRKRLTKAQAQFEDGIVELFEAGYSPEDIGLYAGMTRQNVYNVVKRRKRDEAPG